MSERFHITVAEPAAPAALAVIDSGIDDHNTDHGSLQGVRALHVLARSTEGAVLGGAVGRTWGRCAELQQLWVADAQRGCGLGTALMRAFEDEAANRACDLLYLESFSFQAPGFYHRLGYADVLRIAGFPDGVVKHYLQKRLRTDRTAPGGDDAGPVS